MKSDQDEKHLAAYRRLQDENESFLNVVDHLQSENENKDGLIFHYQRENETLRRQCASLEKQLSDLQAIASGGFRRRLKFLVKGR